MKIGILNSAILTSNGVFKLSEINLEEVKELVKENKDKILSAIGHQSTADILTELLGIKIPMNRITFIQETGQKVIIFKLNGRAPEGVILDKEEIEEIGYKFQLLEKID